MSHTSTPAPSAQAAPPGWSAPPEGYARVTFHLKNLDEVELQPTKPTVYKTTYIPIAKASVLRTLLMFMLENGILPGADLRDAVGVSNKGFRYTFLPFFGAWEQQWAKTTFTDICIVYEKRSNDECMVVIMLFRPLDRAFEMFPTTSAAPPPTATPLTATAGNILADRVLGYGNPVPAQPTSSGGPARVPADGGTDAPFVSGGYQSIGSGTNAGAYGNYMQYPTGQQLDFPPVQPMQPSIADPFVLLNGGFPIGNGPGQGLYTHSCHSPDLNNFVRNPGIGQNASPVPILRSNAALDQYGNIVPLPKTDNRTHEFGSTGGMIVSKGYGSSFAMGSQIPTNPPTGNGYEGSGFGGRSGGSPHINDGNTA